jgi:O-antigen/teichoic acid export membrane protein
MSLLESIRLRIGGLSGRSKTVGLFVATSLGARAVGICCQMFQIPIAVKALGQEAFGLWMTITGVGFMLTFADFGMGQGAQNKLAEAFASGGTDRARDLFGSVAAFLALVGVVLAGVVACVVPAFNFTTLFHLTAPDVQMEASRAITVSLLLFCLGFPLGLAQRLAYSRQLGWMHNIAQGAGGIGSLLGVVLAAHFHKGLVEFITGAQVPGILANAVLLSIQLVQLGWFKLRLIRWRWETIRELLGLGAYFGIGQVQNILMNSLPQVIISTCLGAAAVTPYNLAQRLFNLFAIIQNAFMLPLWPAYTEAKARGEFGWIRRTLVRSLRATGLFTILPMAFGALFAQRLLRLWVGGHTALPSVTLIWLLFFWNALGFFQQCFGYLLAGVSEMRRLTVYSLLSTGLIAGMMLLFVHRLGREGVVIAMIVGFMPYLVIGNVVETIRYLRRIHRPNEAADVMPETVPSAVERQV